MADLFDEMMNATAHREIPGQLEESLAKRAPMAQPQAQAQAQPAEEGPSAFIQGAAKFNKFVENAGLPRFGAGVFEGLGNGAISLANLAPMAVGSDKRIPHINLQQYAKGDPSMLGNVMGGIGNLTGGLMLGAGGLSGANIPRATGYSGLLQDAVIGGATGFALGEDSEHNRGMATILGATLNPAASLLKSGIAKNLAGEKHRVQESFRKQYGQIFGKAAEDGAESLSRMPKFNAELIKEGSTGKYTKYLDKILNSKAPHLDDVNKARIDLGKWTRSVEKSVEGGTASTTVTEAYKEALGAEKKLRGAIFETLNKSSDKNLGNKFLDVTKRYRAEVVPYTTNKALQQYGRNELKSGKLVNQILANDRFMLGAGKQHPELLIQQALKNLPVAEILKRALGTAVGGGAIYGAHKSGLFGHGENE